MTTPGGMERMLLPVGRPVSAIASGYLALFGIIPVFGLPFSVGAFITGIVALKTIKKDPRLSGSVRAWFGVIVGGVMTLISIVALVGLGSGDFQRTSPMNLLGMRLKRVSSRFLRFTASLREASDAAAVYFTFLP